MPQQLLTSRLALRGLRRSDAGPMTLYGSDLRVARMTASIPHPYPPGAAEAFVESVLNGRSDQDPWVMDATRSGGAELVGLITLKRGEGDLSYWVGPPFWNTGYASEALAEVVRHLFEDMGISALSASVFTDNPASRHILEKEGFEMTGTQERFSVARAAMVPEWQLSLSASAWSAMPRRAAFG
ncbi:MAG: GNAT family N-acetyltransferase [Pseudomonadota bacterium]